MSRSKLPGREDQLDFLLRHLRERIHRGDFVPGQRLIEADLVDETGMSRGKVREALRMLEADGLVELHRNRGASIRRISRQEVSDTLEVLKVISVLMADKAIMRCQEPEARARLEEALAKASSFREQSSRLDYSRHYMDENARFWEVLADLSGNAVLIDTRAKLETTLFRLALEGARITSSKDQWIARHEDILTAVLDGDRDAARRLVEEAVDDVEAAILALPDGVYR